MSSKAPNLKLMGLDDDTSSDGDGEYYDTDNDETDLGLSLGKLSIGPKKKLLILGPGGLLVHRVYIRNREPLHRRPDATLGNFLVFKRPFCSEFLKFCLEKFEVGIWSSARERNLDLLLDMLMEGSKRRLLFRWDQDECTDSGFESLEKKDKPIFLKELSKVWRSFAMKKYSGTNTLLLDDEPHKSLLNPPNTAIFPGPYKAQMENDKVLAPNGELWKFLEGLADAGNVQSYVEENRIGQTAITDSHSDWEFYSKIKRHFDK